MKIFGVLGMLDTPTVDGRMISSECVNVRGYRPLPMLQQGGAHPGPELTLKIGTLDRYWAEGDTLYYEATITAEHIGEQDIRDDLYSLGMDLSGGSWRTEGDVMLYMDWELRAVKLVARPAGQPTAWPECSIKVAE